MNDKQIDKYAAQLVRDFAKETYETAARFDKEKKIGFFSGKRLDVLRNHIGNVFWPASKSLLQTGRAGLIALGVINPASLPVVVPSFLGVSGLHAFSKGHVEMLQNITLGRASKFGSEMVKAGVPEAVRKKAIEKYLLKNSPAFTAEKYIKKHPELVDRLRDGLVVPKNQNRIIAFDRDINRLANSGANKNMGTHFKLLGQYIKDYASEKIGNVKKLFSFAKGAQKATAEPVSIAVAAGEVSVKKMEQSLMADAAKTVSKTASETVVKKAEKPALEAGAKAGSRLPLSPKLVQEISDKTVQKTGAKLAGKVALKVGAKKIPVLGLAFGAAFATGRAMDGDWTGAGMELSSGAASCFPGAGTATSLAIDGALLARDLKAGR